MDVTDVVLVACTVLILAVALFLINRSFTRARPVHLLAAVNDDNVQPNQARARGVPRVEGGGPARRRARPNRLAATRHLQDDSSSDSDVDNEDGSDDGENQLKSGVKVGAKKQKKLDQKEARKAQREAEAEERKERREYEEKQSRKKKLEEEAREKEEAAKEAEEQRLKEEQARREHEEYLELKKQFSVEAEGIDAQDEQEIESRLKEFISHIEQMKVVMLEDLAGHFKLKTQEVIDRVKALQSEGRLSGVIDDRGKFICITSSEYEAVAKFIKQRGRVSISDLADSMNRLIRLQPEVTNVTSATVHADVAVCS